MGAGRAPAGASCLLFAAAAVAIRALMHRLAEKDRWPVGIIWLIACGFAADWSGLHYMVGAFLAGAVLDSDMFDRGAAGQLSQFRPAGADAGLFSRRPASSPNGRRMD